LLNSNISSTTPHNMANFGPLAAQIGLPVCGNAANLNTQQVSRLGFITAAMSLTRGQPNFARSLAISWAGTLYMYFLGLLPPDRILSGAKFTLCPRSCVLLYWQRYCTALQQWASAKICSVLHGMELWNFHRWRHLYLARVPSRWALSHFLVWLQVQLVGSRHVSVFFFQ